MASMGKLATLLLVLGLGSCGSDHISAVGSGTLTGHSVQARASSVMGPPRLTLSRHSGPAGTRISIRSDNCTHPQGQGDRLSWFDSRSEREVAEHPGLPPAYRIIPLVRTSRTTAKATFVVKRSDSIGRGLLDMWCGPASDGNAISHFTVTR